jgi:hypothetical protein
LILRTLHQFRWRHEHALWREVWRRLPTFASYASFPSANFHVWLPSEWHPFRRYILHSDTYTG